MAEETPKRQRQKLPKAVKRVAVPAQHNPHDTQSGIVQSEHGEELTTEASLIESNLGQTGQVATLTKRSEANAVKQLASNRWHVSSKARRITVERMVELVESDDTRTAISAARALIAMTGQNVSADLHSNSSSPATNVNVQVNVGALSDGQLATMRAARQVIATTARPVE